MNTAEIKKYIDKLLMLESVKIFEGLEYRSTEIIIYILKNANNLLLKDGTGVGNTLIHHISKIRSVEVILEILNNHKKLLYVRNICGRTPLHNIADFENEEIAMELLNREDLDLTCKNINNNTVLHKIFCTNYKNIKIISTIFNKFKPVYLADRGHHGKTLFHSFFNIMYDEFILKILKLDFNINMQDRFGWTPIHCLCIQAYLEIGKDKKYEKRLIDIILRILDLNKSFFAFKDNKGETPIDCLAKIRNYRILVKLAGLKYRDRVPEPPMQPHCYGPI